MTDFGRDTLCTDALRTGRYVTGVRLIAQRQYHALTTPRGALCGDERHRNFGDDLGELVGSDVGPALDAAIRAKVNRAASLDEAVRTATATIKSTQAGDGTWTTRVEVAYDTNEGPFTLVFATIADVTAADLGFPENA